MQPRPTTAMGEKDDIEMLRTGAPFVLRESPVGVTVPSRSALSDGRTPALDRPWYSPHVESMKSKA